MISDGGGEEHIDVLLEGLIFDGIELSEEECVTGDARVEIDAVFVLGVHGLFQGEVFLEGDVRRKVLMRKHSNGELALTTDGEAQGAHEAFAGGVEVAFHRVSHSASGNSLGSTRRGLVEDGHRF